MDTPDITKVNWLGLTGKTQTAEAKLEARGFIEAALRAKEENWRRLEGQADMNIAWFGGRQDSFYHETTNQIVRVPRCDDDEEYLVYNQIQPNVDTTVAMLGQQVVELDCVPVTDDVEDEEQAELNTDILKHYQTVLEVDRFMEIADRWAVITGSAYAKVCWEPNKGSGFSVGPEELGMSDREYRDRYGDIRELFFGDVSIDVIPLFNLYWEPQSCPLREADWVMEVYDRSPAYVMERYDLKADDITVGAAHNTMIWRAGEYAETGSRKFHSSPENMVRVVVLWVRPQPRLCPRGAHVVMAGGKVIQSGPIPYQHRRIPIVDYQFIPQLGSHVGMSPIENAIHPQHDLNRCVSQMAANRELFGNPFVLTPDGGITDEDEWNSGPGGMRRFNQGFDKPEIVAGTGMPSMVIAQLQNAMRQIQDTFGIRDVTQARNPAGVRSAAAITSLKASDDTRFGPIRERRERFVCEVFQLVLQTAAQYVAEPRLARIFGDEDEYRVVEYTGEMMTGQKQRPDVNYFDVKVRNSGVPRTREQDEELVLKILQYSKSFDLSDPMLREKVFDILKWGDPINRMNPNRRDRQNQKRRNQVMLSGQMEPPQMFDNFDVLQDELNRFRKGGAYRQAGDEIKRIFQQYEVMVLQSMVYAKAIREQIIQQAAVQSGLVPNPAQPQPQQPQPNPRMNGTPQPQLAS